MSGRRDDKGRLPPFVPVLKATWNSLAWRTMSFPARLLYIALKGRVLKSRNTAFLSHRDAAKEIGCARSSVGNWFNELQHYGFVVMESPGCLGVEGKGKSPHWRLPELGQTSKASAGGVWEPPTNDFLKWDGTRYQKTESRPAKQDRVSVPLGHQCPSGQDTNCGNCPTEQAIEEALKCPSKQAITSNH
jgi:hypothetical protein